MQARGRRLHAELLPWLQALRPIRRILPLRMPVRGPGTPNGKMPAGDGAPVRLILALEYSLWNEIVAAALRGETGIEIVAALTPEQSQMPPNLAAGADVALVSLPTTPARWALFRRLRQLVRPARMLVVGGDDLGFASRVLRAGAGGYFYGAATLPMLLKAIRNVSRGELWADHRLAACALEAEPDGAGNAARLTDRETRVLAAVSQGKRNKEIAAELAIAEATVKTHLNRIYRKLGVSDRLQAGLAALEFRCDAPS